MAEERVRRPLLLRVAMEIVRDAGPKLPVELYQELRSRVQLTPYELSVDNSGLPRYDRAVGFMTGDAATVGWVSKINGWSITEAGAEALDTYSQPMSCLPSWPAVTVRLINAVSRLRRT